MQPKRESEAIRRQQLEARPTPDAATDAVQVDVQVDVHVDSRLWKAEDIGGCLWAASVDGVDQRQRALRSSGSLANGTLNVALRTTCYFGVSFITVPPEPFVQ